MNKLESNRHSGRLHVQKQLGSPKPVWWVSSKRNQN